MKNTNKQEIIPSMMKIYFRELIGFSFLSLSLKDEKNQVLITNAWLQMVSNYFVLSQAENCYNKKVVRHDPMVQEYPVVFHSMKQVMEIELNPWKH